MRKAEAKNSLFEMCPIRNVIARFGNKWSFLVLLVVSENNPIRFNELSKAIPDISSRVLSNTLKDLEEDGFLHRKVYPTVPPKVEYSLTEIGTSVIPLIGQLTQWAQDNMEAIIKHRDKAQSSKSE